MRFFDIFRNKKAPVIDKTIQTIYFNNFSLFKVLGKDESNWYDADVLVLNGKRYDLNSVDSINSIPIITADFSDTPGEFGTTGMLDYVLRMKAGGCYNRNEKELCSALLWKSTMLMEQNKGCCWRSKDYQRLVSWHYELGMIEEAEAAEKYLVEKGLLEHNSFDSLALSIADSTLQRCKQYGDDLVVFHNHFTCCEECSILTGRVYSISGRDKVFPRLPNYVREHGNFHPGCRCTMSPYFGGYVLLHGQKVDAITASSRPYVDDRTPEQKKEYAEYVARVTREREYEKSKLADKKEYAILLRELPSDAPKSFGAYRRMKNANTTGYQKLKTKAAEIGIEI